MRRIGFRRQADAPPSEIIVRLEMLDQFTVDRQETVGLAGVNLLYGAFYCREDPASPIGALPEGLSRERLEVDMTKVSGPGFGSLE